MPTTTPPPTIHQAIGPKLKAADASSHSQPRPALRKQGRCLGAGAGPRPKEITIAQIVDFTTPSVQLPFLPRLAGPVPAAFVLTERDAWAGFPSVLMYRHMGVRRVGVFFFGMPTNVATADNRCRRAYRQEGKDARAHCGAEKLLNDVISQLRFLCSQGSALRVRSSRLLGAASLLSLQRGSVPPLRKDQFENSIVRSGDRTKIEDDQWRSQRS